MCLLNTYGSIFYLAREWIKTSVAEMLKLKALVLFFICLQKLHFDIYFALCLHIMISIFDKNALYVFYLLSFSFCVLEQSMIKDVMVTQQQTDGLWPDRGLVGNRSMLSDISHTSGKLSSVLFDGSAEKETDLYKNAQCFFKSLPISQLHSVGEKWVWLLFLTDRKV